jgi:hypothetical protein
VTPSIGTLGPQRAIERALVQEAYLAQALACAGMTSIRKANYGDPGRMYEALFGLSQAIERIGKLIFVAERYATTGAYPGPDELKNRYGHDLKKILRDVTPLAAARGVDLAETPAQNAGSRAVVNFLTKFAQADRYFNVSRLAQGDSLTIDDPISRWQKLVRVNAPAPRAHTARDTRNAQHLAMARDLDQRVPLAVLNGCR